MTEILPSDGSRQPIGLQASLAIKGLSDLDLTKQLLVCRDRERSSSYDVLLCLAEFDARRLADATASGSLYSYCLDVLGYTKDEAFCRISAMKLLQRLPEIGPKVADGSLGLSASAKVEAAIRRENRRRQDLRSAKLSNAEALAVAQSVIGASTRNCDRILAEAFGDLPEDFERTRSVSGGRTVIQFSVDEEGMGKLTKLKELTAHGNFSGRWEKLFLHLAELGLEKHDPQRKARRAEKRKALNTQAAVHEDSEVEISGNDAVVHVAQRVESQSDSQSRSQPQSPSQPHSQSHSKSQPRSKSKSRKKRAHIPAGVRRIVWSQRSEGCCYVDPRTKERCGSRHALQIDHAHPLGLGGNDSPENLRLLCSVHNSHLAREIWPSEHWRKS